MKSFIALLLLSIVCVYGRAPLHLTQDVIENSYIVVLNDNVTASLREEHISRVSMVGTFSIAAKWEVVLNGYSATMSREVLEEVLNDPIVSFVEQDHLMYAIQSQSTQNLGGNAAGLWGLARIWQRTVSSTTQYTYFTSAGSGVDAYIVDTGIYAAHTEFTGRTATGNSFVSDPSYPGTADGNGHGTHVASTVAGTTYGVAKSATLIPVKVLSSSGSGSTTGVVSGVEWVATNRAARGNRPSVANLSLGGSASTALDNAVNNAVTAGSVFVVAAGNENQNACNVSPARAANAITVGATTNTNARSSFSNFGTCVTVFAPGSNILGAWIGGTSATNTISGTSMASPHVAGGAALFLGQSSTKTTAATRSYIVNSATSGVVTSPGTGSPNLLLFTLAAIN
eukprot:TRINITY_DN1581_c1_g1_i2.p1 TRINITY_DN1581_c1_g1~~TRINITY_DN1581_c1_g1_i2.p1  ORF type:complete len:398 (-),score=75.34 TRINITY_DN1581_c1_g1_i2:97-1290(-)